MKIHSKIYLLVFLLLACKLCFSQVETIKKLDSILVSTKPILFTGSVLVKNNNKTLYQNAQGFSDSTKAKKITTSDAFKIMSNSKQFTAVLILKAQEQGKLKVSDAIGLYLKDLKLDWKNKVTIHQLLNHTHGIKSVDDALLFTPGSQFKYGNLSYALLGKILENVYKKSYLELVNQLFKEVGMTKSYCFSENERSKAITGYMNLENQLSPVSRSFLTNDIRSAAGIISTPEDLNKWNQALFNGKILKPKSLKMLLTPSTKSQHQVFGTQEMGFGYSVRLIQEKGYHYYAITGLGDGFTLLNCYFPKSKTSVIVMENQMPEESEFWSYNEAAIKNIVLENDWVKKDRKN